MDAVFNLETSIFSQTTRPNIRVRQDLHQHTANRSSNVARTRLGWRKVRIFTKLRGVKHEKTVISKSSRQMSGLRNCEKLPDSVSRRVLTAGLRRIQVCWDFGWLLSSSSSSPSSSLSLAAVAAIDKPPSSNRPHSSLPNTSVKQADRLAESPTGIWCVVDRAS